MSTLPDIDAIIAEIDDRGFCLVPNVIPPAKADEARHALHALLDAEITEQARQARTQRVGQIAVKHPVFLELMCHPFVLAVWKKMLGEDIMCATWSANTTYPGFDSIGWHSDYPYWSLQPPWPPGNFAGQTLWLLDDFTVENGATADIPYSHKKGHPPPPETSNQWTDEGEIFVGTRGSIVFGHGAWWHTARPNQTARSLSCLLGMYLMPWFIPQEDMRGQLAQLTEPSELVQQLLCGKQHTPNSVGVY